ncbi:hypothetical protein M9H77_27673 [Catharanthus roseus]|uniref:Uncharacterized protein n=1 Tax=Catharanthus roseus TaxID=4058 RepID=A0ACC0AF25_CATRO|nr:hypothetical protein M9H77_27673 [Catharanthus roseus]
MYFMFGYLLLLPILFFSFHALTLATAALVPARQNQGVQWEIAIACRKTMKQHLKISSELCTKSKICLYAHTLWLRKDKEALEMIERAIIADRKNPLPLYQKANILLSMDNLDGALEVLQELKEHAPQGSSVYPLMGRTHKGVTCEMRCIEVATSLSSIDIDVTVTYGKIKESSKDASDVIQLTSEAIGFATYLLSQRNNYMSLIGYQVFEVLIYGSFIFLGLASFCRDRQIDVRQKPARVGRLQFLIFCGVGECKSYLFLSSY